jgi:hypothetical protein
MRFPTTFRRRVGATPDELKELGKDEPPTGGRPEKADNFHESRLVNANGFPSQRVVVGLVGPKEAAGRRVPVEAWLHVDDVGWLRVPGDEDVAVGGLAYFDTPCLIDHGRSRSDNDGHNPGALEVVVVPRPPKKPALPPGIYAFVLGTDVSNPGR